MSFILSVSLSVFVFLHKNNGIYKAKYMLPYTKPMFVAIFLNVLLSLSLPLALSLSLCVSLSLHNVELPSANLDSWMSSNRLSLNPFKIQLTQLLLLDRLCLGYCRLSLPSYSLLFAL